MSWPLSGCVEHPDKLALEFPERSLTYGELAGAAAALASRLRQHRRVAIWAETQVETCVALVAALQVAADIVPLNPKLGERELSHVIADAAPDVIVRAPSAVLPLCLSQPSITVDLDVRPQEMGVALCAAANVILYTSGTTGPPKGAVLSYEGIAVNLHALAEAWAWTANDVLVQALPLFHAHGLILGVLGTLLCEATVRHVGRFEPEAIGAALRDGATMLFAVPTMYRRLATACEADPGLAEALAGARILVSGSAALSVREHVAIQRLTGQRIIERYGLTETLMVCVVRHDGDRRPGYVGPPLDGVEIRLLDDNGWPLSTDVADDETVGEIAVRSPSLFDGYLDQPDATAAVMDDGWFRTGDLATIAPDGYVRIIGRRSTDLIKTGGYRVGAGEVESALRDHASVADVAVLGRPDDDLGERIVAWVVADADSRPSEEELIEHVRRLLSSHKRPREIRFVAELPRNALGKVQKAKLPR